MWPQYRKFRQLAKDYQTRSGENQGAISAKLGINLFTYRNYLYGSKKPGIKTLQAAARLFGVSITEFVDNPGTPPPGIERDLWQRISERDRVLGTAILEDLTSISDQEKEVYLDMWKQGFFKAIAKMRIEEANNKLST